MVKRFLGIVLIFIIFIMGKLYFQSFYLVDISPFRWSYCVGYIESPDNQYQILLNIYKENEESEEAYLGGWLNDSQAKEPSEAKIIFWKKTDSAHMENINRNGLDFPYWVEAKWIDKEQVSIDGIIFNIHSGYDYRRISIFH